MISFGYELSRIEVEAKAGPDGEISHLRYSWVGDTPYIACSFELINDLEPRFCECPRVLELKPGSIAKMRPLVFEAVAIYPAYDVVIFKRLDDEPLPDGVMDADGWVKAID